MANNKSKKNKPRRSRNRRARSRSKLLSGNQQMACPLSPTAQNYMAALLDPIRGPLVGIPDGSAVLTKKYRVWTRGTMTSGPGGAGHNTDLTFLVNPWGCLTNTQNVVAWQEPTGSGLLPIGMNVGTAGTVNAPYTLASLSSSISARLVSCQFRMRYSGTQLNQGGTIIGLQEPTHAGLQSQSVTGLFGHSAAKRESILDLNGKWFTLEYKPSDVYDTYFVNGVAAGTGTHAYDAAYTADGVTVAWDQYPFMGGYVSCPAASSPFDYEVWAIIEYAGANVAGKSLNPPDTQGFHQVVSAVAVLDEKQGLDGTGPGAQFFQELSNQRPYYEKDPKTGLTSITHFTHQYDDEAPSSGANIMNSVASLAGRFANAALPYADAAVRRYGPSIAASLARMTLQSRAQATQMPRIEFIN